MTLVLLVPSRAAALEIPRRLAERRGALADIYALTVRDLVRALAEPLLLGRGLRAWNPGHGALLAARLLDDAPALVADPRLPRAPIARALARTLADLRAEGVAPGDLAAAEIAAAGEEDLARLRAVASVYERFLAEVAAFADPVALLQAAAAAAAGARWLRGAEVLVTGDLELDSAEKAFLSALSLALPVRRLAHDAPPGLVGGSFGAWADTAGISTVAAADTVLAPLIPADVPEGLRRLRRELFEPARAGAADSMAGASLPSVELLTAPGEAAEVRAVVRRLLREARRGVPFEEMGVILPRPNDYAPIVTDLLTRIGIPHRLHPSLPLRYGRCARALLLLFRCRGLARSSVIELLTFAPLPVDALLGEGRVPRRGRWDAVSRDASIVAGYERWMVGLRAYTEAAQQAALHEEDDARRQWHVQRANDGEDLLRLVELLNATLLSLEGRATWREWSQRLHVALDQWVGPERDRVAVSEVIADLAALDDVSGAATHQELLAVLEARFEWERVPLEPIERGGVHVGALDAMAGLPFRVVAILGLAEGSYPGVLRPDPFLLDGEREALRSVRRDVAPAAASEVPPSANTVPRRGASPRDTRQMSLFDREAASATPVVDARPLAQTGGAERGPGAIATAQDRLLEARRAFHGALSQATEMLLLSYPRADPRTGRERMPSLFFAAAASTLAGRPLDAAGLSAVVHEDEAAAIDTGDALDATERDRGRVLRGGAEAVLAVASGSTFFKWSHLAAHRRFASELTTHDGLVTGLPEELAARLDPLRADRPMSASGLGLYAKCGFLYLLQRVLSLEPVEDPVERLWLDPMEMGLLFHDVAERFLRARRDAGKERVTDDDEARTELLALARRQVAALVADRPPRHRLVWDMRWRAFEDLLTKWLTREAAQASRIKPIHFEVAFGLSRHEDTNEPHDPRPLEILLDDGTTLRVGGKIDRIDEKEDGTLVLRDYKTGRPPKDMAGVFRGGRELQIPLYVRAAERLFPGRIVSEAYLDYVTANPVKFEPTEVTGPPFVKLLTEMVTLVRAGAFVPEPSSCKWCDFGEGTCGPQPLLEVRLRYKQNDPRVRRYLRLKDYR